jgi:hypothetical protein
VFFPHNQTLTSPLDTNDTIVLTLDGVPRDFDEFRFSPADCVLSIDDSRYEAPTDFTITSDGSGNLTLEWLNVATIATGKVLRMGIAYYDLIVKNGTPASGGGGSTDMTVTNGLLTDIKNGIAATAPSAVYGATKWTNITFTGDTGALAAGDIIADTQSMVDSMPVSDQPGVVISAMFYDEDDQTWATGNGVRVVLFRANRSLGTENAAVTISDANARDIVCMFDITSDVAIVADFGGVKVASLGNIMRGITPVDDTDDLYVGLVNLTGTPTYAGGAPKLALLIGA